MIKVLGVFFASIMLLLLMSPFAVGIVIKSNTEEITKKIDISDLLDVSTLRHEIGYLSSTYKFLVSFVDRASVVVLIDVQHLSLVNGLKIGKFDGQFGWVDYDGSLSDKIEISALPDILGDIQGYFQLSGKGITWGTLFANNVAIKDSRNNIVAKIEWSDLDFKEVSDLEMSFYKSENMMDKISIKVYDGDQEGNYQDFQNEIFSVTAKDLYVGYDVENFDFAQWPYGLLEGLALFEFGHLEATTNSYDNETGSSDAIIFSLNDFVVSSNIENINDNYSISYYLSSGKLVTDNYNAEDLILDASVTNIDKDFAQVYFDSVRALSKQTLDSSSENFVAEALIVPLVSKLPALLAKKPNITVKNMQAEFEEGTFTGDMNINYIGDSSELDLNALEGQLNINMPALIASKLLSHLLTEQTVAQLDEVDIDEQSRLRKKLELRQLIQSHVATVAEVQIEQFANQGYIFREGDSYGTTFNLERGLQLTANGQPIVVPTESIKGNGY